MINKPNIQSFGSFIKRPKRLESPRVELTAQVAAGAAKRSASLLGGVSPRLGAYGFSKNTGGKNGVLGPIKQSGRLATLYRASQR
jgi:hypothetical protein